MPERYLRQSPLARLGLGSRSVLERGAAGVAMAERPFHGLINLRGKPDDEAFVAGAGQALGIGLPVEAHNVVRNDSLAVFWLSPEEWLVQTEDSEQEAAVAQALREALAGCFTAVTQVGESRTCIAVEGPRARDLLAKGTPLDLHPRILPLGRCAQSHLANAMVLVHYIEEDEEAGPRYELIVLRSFAEYLWRWLEDAGQEYGVAVLA